MARHPLPCFLQEYDSMGIRWWGCAKNVILKGLEAVGHSQWRGRCEAGVSGDLNAKGAEGRDEKSGEGEGDAIVDEPNITDHTTISYQLSIDFLFTELVILTRGADSNHGGAS